jgi:hypothetical protein
MSVERESYPAVSDTPPTATAQAPRRSSPLGPLRSRNFSLLFWGQLISVLGDQAYSLALLWTMLFVVWRRAKFCEAMALAAFSPLV